MSNKAPSKVPNASYCLHEVFKKTVDHTLYKDFVYTHDEIFVPFCRDQSCSSITVENPELEYLLTLDVAFEVVRMTIVDDTNDLELANRVIARMQNDTKLVSYGVACTAWLSFSGFKWYKIKTTNKDLQDKVCRIPQNLDYGLVARYPNSVLAFSKFVLGISRNSYIESIGTERITLLRNLRSKDLNSRS